MHADTPWDSDVPVCTPWDSIPVVDKKTEIKPYNFAYS